MILPNQNDPSIKTTPFIGLGKVSSWLYRSFLGSGTYIPAPGLWVHDSRSKRDALYFEKQAQPSLVSMAHFLMACGLASQNPEFPVLSRKLSSIFQRLPKKEKHYLQGREHQPVRYSLPNDVNHVEDVVLVIGQTHYISPHASFVPSFMHVFNGLNRSLSSPLSSLSISEALSDNAEEFLAPYTLLGHQKRQPLSLAPQGTNVLHIDRNRVIHAQKVPRSEYNR